MATTMLHTFHIPVLGIGYSIDTPVKVARFGISSVISIMDDQLIEKMSAYHAQQAGKSYTPIGDKEYDHRARRITAYLNLIDEIVNEQTENLRQLPFDGKSEISKYFDLQPEGAAERKIYQKMMAMDDGEAKQNIQTKLRAKIAPGAIDVNIMSKIDRLNTDENGNLLPADHSDALAALRGFANSTVSSSVIFSAGYNPRLYNYIEQFPDFYPDKSGHLKKKIILKVSDYRSALVQGKIFAKKGLWVSEFRIESGLNCGGHAFATDGLLLGPILSEFRDKRADLATELFSLYSAANAEKGNHTSPDVPAMKITAQGGI